MNIKRLSGIMAFAAILLPASITAQTADFNIIPMPQQTEIHEEAPFTLDARTRICYPKRNDELKRNAQLLAGYIEELTGLRPETGYRKTDGPAIVLETDPTTGNDEGYTLEVTAQRIRIAGSTGAGVFYGIQTLRKALPATGQRTTAISIPAVRISDAPRFAYRGTHLDVSRHFFGPDSIRRFIDMLALHNINRFHWHLTDDQGWRIEIKKYPRLTTVGAVRAGTAKPRDRHPYGGFYTQDEIRDIVEYARERYITIIPEIDLPGHMQAALAAYPELGCTGGPYEVRQEWGISDDVLCAGNDRTLTFIGDVLEEVAALFPSEYIHVGGDECPKKRWKKCPKCQARIRQLQLKARDGHTAEERLQSYIIGYAAQRLQALGRRIIGWDEIMEGGLPEGATVMSWRGEKGGIAAARLGHDVIMTPNTYLYFDYYQARDKKKEPKAIGGYLPLEKVYAYEPVPASLKPAEAGHIIGVQANLWTEYMPTFRQVEYMALPRLAALSEVQWSEAGKKDFGAFRKRLLRMFRHYDRAGYRYARHLLDVAASFSADTTHRAVIARLNTVDGAEIRYTLDGSRPHAESQRYAGPLHLQQPAELRAVALRNGESSAESSERIVFNKATACPVRLLAAPHPDYAFGGAAALTDGLLADDTNFRTGRWVGFYQNDLDLVVDLHQPTTVARAEIRCCVDKTSWVVDTRGMEVSLSQDGKTFTTVAKKDVKPMTAEAADRIYTHRLDFVPTTARYVRLRALTERSLPDWHPGKGKPAFLFVDEISVE